MILLQLISPKKGLNYFYHYRQLMKSTLITNDNNHHPNHDQYIDYRTRHIIIVILVLAMNVFKAIHYIFLALYPLDPQDRILHFDCLHLLLPNTAKFNLIAGYNQLVNIVYVDYILLFRSDWHLNETLYRIMFYNDCSMFRQKQYFQWNEMKKWKWWKRDDYDQNVVAAKCKQKKEKKNQNNKETYIPKFIRIFFLLLLNSLVSTASIASILI